MPRRETKRSKVSPLPEELSGALEIPGSPLSPKQFSEERSKQFSEERSKQFSEERSKPPPEERSTSLPSEKPVRVNPFEELHLRAGFMQTKPIVVPLSKKWLGPEGFLKPSPTPRRTQWKKGGLVFYITYDENKLLLQGRRADEDFDLFTMKFDPQGQSEFWEMGILPNDRPNDRPNDYRPQKELIPYNIKTLSKVVWPVPDVYITFCFMVGEEQNIPVNLFLKRKDILEGKLTKRRMRGEFGTNSNWLCEFFYEPSSRYLSITGNELNNDQGFSFGTGRYVFHSGTRIGERDLTDHNRTELLKF